jgi:hypothetical protein
LPLTMLKILRFLYKVIGITCISFFIVNKIHSYFEGRVILFLILAFSIISFGSFDYFDNFFIIDIFDCLDNLVCFNLDNLSYLKILNNGVNFCASN